jgi:hypothetical protein
MESSKYALCTTYHALTLVWVPSFASAKPNNREQEAETKVENFILDIFVYCFAGKRADISFIVSLESVLCFGFFYT